MVPEYNHQPLQQKLTIIKKLNQMQNYVKPHISTNKAEADDQTKMGKQCE
jgi:hypothetical protein